MVATAGSVNSSNIVYRMWWVGVVLVLLFSAGRGFITRNNFQNRCSKLQLSYEDIYSDEISDILVNYLAKDLSTGGVGTLDSTELIENAHILTKGRL